VCEVHTHFIEYRNGNSPSFYPTSFYPTKMPGLGRVGNVTMRKGIFVNDEKFWKWYNEINLNTIARRTVIINLLDETANPKLVWTLNNASPTKITGSTWYRRVTRWLSSRSRSRSKP
jgi:phage tail-like protein